MIFYKNTKFRLVSAGLLALLTSQSCLNTFFPFLPGGQPTSFGVLKSIDGGTRWQQSNRVQDKPNSSVSVLSVKDMLFDPKDNKTIYLVTQIGIVVSRNAAATWSQLLSKISAQDMYIDPSNSKNMYVAGSFGSHGKILHTSDGGASWEEYYNEPVPSNAANTVVANPSNPQEILVGMSKGAVLKSPDGGINWQVLADLKKPIVSLRYGKMNRLLYAFFSDGIMLSADNGVTWKDLPAPASGKGIQRFSMVDDAPGIIFITTSSGLYKSADNGRSWSQLAVPSTKTDQPARAVAAARGGSLIYVSVFNTMLKSLNGGQTWQTQALPVSSPPSKILIDPQSDQTIYVGLGG